MSRFSLLDLCRASLITRVPDSRLDKPISLKGDDEAQKLFARHADCQTEWTWKRLAHARGCVIALGYTAEYGLLRLFSEKGCRIEDSATHRPLKFKNHRKDFAWTVYYPAETIESRLTSRTYWKVEHGQRRWMVVPIYHPQSAEGRCQDPATRKP